MMSEEEIEARMREIFARSYERKEQARKEEEYKKHLEQVQNLTGEERRRRMAKIEELCQEDRDIAYDDCILAGEEALRQATYDMYK